MFESENSPIEWSDNSENVLPKFNNTQHYNFATWDRPRSLPVEPCDWCCWDIKCEVYQLYKLTMGDKLLFLPYLFCVLIFSSEIAYIILTLTKSEHPIKKSLICWAVCLIFAILLIIICSIFL